MNAVERFNGNFEPLAVEPVGPIMGQSNKYEPPQQQTDIHHGAPGQNFSYDFNCHNSSSFMILWVLG
jgi:hypothetical protein